MLKKYRNIVKGLQITLKFVPKTVPDETLTGRKINFFTKNAFWHHLEQIKILIAHLEISSQFQVNLNT